MKQMFVDLHCDTLLTTYLENKSLKNAAGHIDLKKLADGGALLQCFAAFVPMHETAARYGIKETPWEFFMKLAARFGHCVTSVLLLTLVRQPHKSIISSTADMSMIIFMSLVFTDLFICSFRYSPYFSLSLSLSLNLHFLLTSVMVSFMKASIRILELPCTSWSL